MATKAELRQSYVSNGWTVQQVADWMLVSSVEGVVKYDVNVVDPDKERFITVQVVVTDDGGPSESAEARGRWVDTPSTFDEDLRAYIRSLEGTVPNTFAIVIVESFAADEVAVVRQYMTDGTAIDRVAKRRNDTFSQTALA
jgi:hypothetical protein